MDAIRTVPVLLYHSVCTDPAPLMREWSITPDRFREHLAFLNERGYTTATVSEYVDMLRFDLPLPEQLALVTFDDGFADFATAAAPALVDAGIAATIYISTAYVGGLSSWLGPDGEQPMLTWDAIEKIAELRGIEIGAHAHHHWALDELDDDSAELEIGVSKKLIDRHLGRSIRSFAYPHGYHSRKIQVMVHRAGFDNACGVKEALSGPGDDEFALARIMLRGDASVEQLDSLMRGSSRAPRHERLQTKAWRVARRTRARLEPRKHADALDSA
jgi:peptidoglycan/xylan/chitin deacetylase (PgdA/CDA1 family)